jgi:hypothetical protein
VPTVSHLPQLFHVLLDGGAVAGDTQLRIFRFAQATKKTDLMVRLAGLPTLTGEVDAALFSVKVAAVRAAWLARPGRPVADITAAVRNDSRVAVLKTVAGLPNLPDEVYDWAAAAGHTDVDTALLANDQAAGRARTAAAVRQITEEQVFGDSDMWRKVQHVCKDVEGAADAVISAGAPHWVLGQLADVRHLNEASVDRLLDLLEEVLTSAGDDERLPYRIMAGLTESVPMSPAQRTRLAGLALNRQGNLVPRLRGSHDWSNRDLARKVAGRRAGTAPEPDVPAALDAMVDFAVRRSDRIIAGRVLQHPDVTAVQVWKLRANGVLRHVPAGFIDRYAGDPAMTAAVLTHAEIDDTTLDSAADPVAVLKEYLKLYLDNGMRFKFPLMQSRYLRDEHVRILPVRVLTSEDYPSEVRRPLAAWVDRQTGGGAAWETFEALSVDETMLLGDAVDASRLIAEPAG